MFARGIEDTVPMMQAKLSDMFNAGTVTLQGMGGGGNVAYIELNVNGVDQGVEDVTRALRLRGWQV
jgi:hypothetical protein